MAPDTAEEMTRPLPSMSEARRSPAPAPAAVPDWSPSPPPSPAAPPALRERSTSGREPSCSALAAGDGPAACSSLSSSTTMTREPRPLGLAAALPPPRQALKQSLDADRSSSSVGCAGRLGALGGSAAWEAAGSALSAPAWGEPVPAAASAGDAGAGALSALAAALVPAPNQLSTEPSQPLPRPLPLPPLLLPPLLLPPAPAPVASPALAPAAAPSSLAPELPPAATALALAALSASADLIRESRIPAMADSRRGAGASEGSDPPSVAAMSAAVRGVSPRATALRRAMARSAASRELDAFLSRWARATLAPALVACWAGAGRAGAERAAATCAASLAAARVRRCQAASLSSRLPYDTPSTGPPADERGSAAPLSRRLASWRTDMTVCAGSSSRLVAPLLPGSLPGALPSAALARAEAAARRSERVPSMVDGSGKETLPSERRGVPGVSAKRERAPRAEGPLVPASRRCLARSKAAAAAASAAASRSPTAPSSLPAASGLEAARGAASRCRARRSLAVAAPSTTPEPPRLEVAPPSDAGVAAAAAVGEAETAPDASLRADRTAPPSTLPPLATTVAAARAAPVTAAAAGFSGSDTPSPCGRVTSGVAASLPARVWAWACWWLAACCWPSWNLRWRAVRLAGPVADAAAAVRGLILPAVGGILRRGESPLCRACSRARDSQLPKRTGSARAALSMCVCHSERVALSSQCSTTASSADSRWPSSKSSKSPAEGSRTSHSSILSLSSAMCRSSSGLIGC
mmetsp:Transcript_10261/g.39890  ORF Transcript_10261/g.39890 Transcript_10261/m.39890 type:complete len:755 (+) Transcript_10261:184-2448(+)